LLGFAPRSDGPERQFGAIPYRGKGDELEFLLVTSRRTGRWIFPKGGRVALLSPHASAAQEAYEEAGVEGKIASEPLGSYRGRKVRPAGEVEIEIQMFPLAVEVELRDWPEKQERRRRWVSAEEACALLDEPDLAAFVRTLSAETQD
jgi:8-oxo-dGTP pyrophosphatase MutT (NUDIX family)